MRFLLLAALLGCRPTATPTPITQASVPIRTEIVTLDPDRLTYGADTATLEPDTGVKAATYTTWVLDLASLERALGGRPKRPVDVTVQVTDEQTRVVVPDDPNLPAPSGGFRYVTLTGTVVR